MKYGTSSHELVNGLPPAVVRAGTTAILCQWAAHVPPWPALVRWLGAATGLGAVAPVRLLDWAAGVAAAGMLAQVRCLAMTFTETSFMVFA